MAEEVQPGSETPQTDAVDGDAGTEQPVLQDEQRRNTRIENRFQRLTRRLHQKDTELAELRGQLTTVMELVKRPEAGQPAPRPNRDHFADEDAYLEAVLDWRDQRKSASQAQQAPAQAPVAPSRAAYLERLEEARKTFDDYDEVVEAAEVEVSRPVSEAILESEHGPALVYYLAQHPVAAEKLNALGPVALGRELARLEALTSKTAPPRTAPPTEQPTASAPIRPLSGGRAAGERDPSRMTPEQYRQWREGGGGTG